MKIKDFVSEYNEIIPDSLKGKYIQENLKIVEYVPFIRKDALVQNLVDATTYKYEDIITDGGEVEKRRTNIIQLNSTIQQLMFCRMIIEAYTDLEIENPSFYEEYDLLHKSGLLYELLVDDDNHESWIPASEITELRAMVKAKQDDAVFNHGTVQSILNDRLEQLIDGAEKVVRPIIEKLGTKLDKMDEKTIDKLIDKLGKLSSKK